MKLPKPASPPTNRIEALRNASKMYETYLAAKLGPTPSILLQSYHSISLRDGHESTLKIHRPASGPSGPLVVLMFSGAFIAGSIEQTSQIARAVATCYSATVVSIGYRLAPENPFPTAVHDAIDSVRWVAANASSELLGADPARGFILGGASSGGNLTAVLSRYFQKPENQLPWPLTGQWIGIANLLDDSDSSMPNIAERMRMHFQSRKQNEHAPILDATALAAGAKALQCDEMTSELRFPRTTTEAELVELEDQPRTYFQVCGMDPLRDDGLIYDELLREAGVSTRVALYKGCPHGFWLVIPEQDTAKRAVEDIVMGIGWLLKVEADRDRVKAVLAA
jgi:acetyl esterase/lipase